MRNRFSLFLCLIALLIAALPSGAHAEVLNSDCQDGDYMVGLAAMAHDYVDRMGAVCAPWQPGTHHLGATYNGPVLALSGGGDPQRPVCPPDQAMTGIDYLYVLINGPYVIERVQLTCQAVMPPHGQAFPNPQIQTFGDAETQNYTSRDGPAPPKSSHCLVGQVATGFDADVYQYVGEVKLHCASWPATSPPQPPPPNLALPPGAEANLDRPGSDFSWGDLPTADPQLCYQRCQANGTCRSWTYVNPGIKSANAYCYLKNAIPYWKNDPCCVSGVKADSGPMTKFSPEQRWALIQKTRTSGQDFARRSSVSALSAAGFDSISGEWQTSEGVVTFAQNGDHLDGTYPNNNGRLSLDRAGNSWTGLRYQARSDHPCRQASRAGGNYWGRAAFIFSNDNRHFDGNWSYCGADAASGAKWTGDRIK